MLGVTHEPKSPTEGFVEATGMRYAYGYDTSMELMRALGVRAFPTAVLVDPGGVIVWQGHPGELSERIVEKALAGALTTPVWEWPKSGKSARKAIGKRAYGKALEALAKLEEPWANEARASITTMATAWVDSIESALEAGNYRYVREGLSEGKTRLDGIEELETRLAELADRYKADPAAKEGLKLQDKLDKLLDRRLNTAKDVSELIRELEQFRADNPGTWAADEAGRRIDGLRDMLR